MNTKEIITTAAFELFEEKPFNDITVQMILDKAHVSRSTFYQYFSDKHALMHLYYRAFMDQNIMANFDGHNWESVLERLLAFVEEKNDYFRNVSETEGQNSFWEFLWQYSFDFYKGIKLRNEKREELTELERMTIIAGVGGSIAVLKQLIEGDVDLERQEVAKLLCTMLPQSYQEYLD